MQYWCNSQYMISEDGYNCHDRDLATSQVNYGLRDVIHMGPNQFCAELEIYHAALRRESPF